MLRRRVARNIWVATLKAKVIAWPCTKIVSGPKLCYLKSDFATTSLCPIPIQGALPGSDRLLFNQVFNENPGYKIGECRAGVSLMVSNCGFRSITLVCFGLLTPNLLYGYLTSRRSLGLLPWCVWSRSRSLLLKIEVLFCSIT